MPAFLCVLRPQKPDRGLRPQELSLTGEKSGHSSEMRGNAVLVLSDGLQMVEAGEMDEGHRASEDSVRFLRPVEALGLQRIGL